MFVFPPGLSIVEKTARLAATWQAFSQRKELPSLDTVELAQIVLLHFFKPQSITRVVDGAFTGASQYSYDKALFAAFTDR